jgi:hypothetical protein
MSKNQKKKQKNQRIVDPTTKRLDALICLFIETNKPKNKNKLNEGSAARLLKSLDFTPSEIAKLLGKKSRTDVTPYLYDKKGRKEDEHKPINLRKNKATLKKVIS